MFNCETDITDYLKEERYWRKHFPHFTLVGFNEPVFGALSRHRVGLVDIVFTKGKTKYFVEVKFDKSNRSGDFWDSLKVLGYVKTDHLYYFKEETKPLVMLNKEILSYDYRVILHTLKIGWIGFTITDNPEEPIFFEVGFSLK